MEQNEVNSNVAIEMKDLTKQFGTFTANDHISMQVNRGEVHGLLGENGAGKTTLMNMLSGILQPTSGEIFVDGQEVHLRSAKDATALGIGMVHQHFMLVQNFTVLENIMLGVEKTNKMGILDRKAARQKIVELSQRYGLQLTPEAKIEDISVGMQQRVEIIKVLYRNADILIFDEPTAVLTPQEIDELLEILKRLASEGKAIILISHKLKELKAVADRTTIIRRGKVIETVEMSSTSPEKLAELMVGHEVSFHRERKDVSLGAEVLKINNFKVVNDQKVTKIHDFNLSIRKGEIVGLAGIDGNGQTELIKAITGLIPSAGGTVEINGKNLTHAEPRKVIRAGVGHIPEDRQRFGLILPMNLVENSNLMVYDQSPYSKGTFINKNEMIKLTKNLLNKYDVRHSSIYETARDLSGGNQQKLIIARELSRDPDLLIAFNPTRGLDVGAIEFIHSQILAARAEGHAILLISYELDELQQLSDRIAVIHDGTIVGQAKTEDLTESEIGLLMAGEQVADKEELIHAN
ncbi:ABC transporter ATP-binding protein [Xylocopilactobacillus apicola]|nr:ABC transporter ATP-binding protein [Xylocopilactobacillus apicola]